MVIIRSYLLSVLISAGALHAQVTINLSTPVLRACGEVEINGVFIAPGLQDVAPYWNWGNGTTTRSFFPATHRYTRDGSYKVTVTIRQNDQVLASSSVDVRIVDAAKPECSDLLVVEPFHVLLRDGVTSQQLTVSRIKPDGTRVPVETSGLLFRSVNSSVAQVNATGVISGSGFGDTTIEVEDSTSGRVARVQTQAGDIRLEPPYVRLSLGATAEAQLRVLAWNANGTPLNLAGRNVQFSSSSQPGQDPVITLSPTGLVRGLRLPKTFSETPVIAASIDGVGSANVTIVRVAEVLPDLPYIDLTSGLTRFHVAQKLGNLDNREVLTQSDVPRLNDLARMWEEHAAGFRVSRGGVRAMIHDVGGSSDPNDPTVPCGLSGNPTRLGASPARDNSSCLIVANPPPQKAYPQWFIYFHEMGHDETLVSTRFSQFASAGPESLGFAIREGFASTLALYAAESLRRNARLSPPVQDEMALNNLFADSPRWTSALREYESAGAPFSKMDPNVMTAIIAQLTREEGLEWYARFHSVFLPHNKPYEFAMQGETQVSTSLVAAISAAIGRDLRERFTRWGFPLDASYFSSIYPEMIQLTRQRQPLLTTRGVTSAASYRAQAVSPESWVALFGDHLAPQFFQPERPETLLESTAVWVTDGAGVERQATLQFVSPGHINVLMPAGMAAGQGRIRVNTWLGDTSVPVSVQTVAPGMFSANATGQGPAAASWLRISLDGSRTQGLVRDASGKLTPIDLGAEGDQVYVSFFGTGFRNQTSSKVTFSGIDVPVYGAVAQGQFDGLDQLVAGPLPRSLAGKGEVTVQATLDGQAANVVTVAIR